VGTDTPEAAPEHPRLDDRPVMVGSRLVAHLDDLECGHEDDSMPCRCPRFFDVEFTVDAIYRDGLVGGTDGEEYFLSQCQWAPPAERVVQQDPDPRGQNPKIDGATRAMAHALCDGPDGEDWLRALRLAPRALEEVEERGYVVISRSLLDELERQAGLGGQQVVEDTTPPCRRDKCPRWEGADDDCGGCWIADDEVQRVAVAIAAAWPRCLADGEDPIIRTDAFRILARAALAAAEERPADAPRVEPWNDETFTESWSQCIVCGSEEVVVTALTEQPNHDDEGTTWRPSAWCKDDGCMADFALTVLPHGFDLVPGSVQGDTEGGESDGR
jgi:hypothetical protein